MFSQAGSGDAPLIITKNLSKSYDNTQALRDLSFELRQNEILGLLGPNGAGKTTAIHIVLGLLTPTSGHVSVMGLDPIREHYRLAGRINFSSSYGNLPSNLKVSENLTVFSRLYAVRDARAKIRGLMETFEISHLANRLTGALSSGEKTRLNLVKSFLNDPVLLILDEPTASMDPDISDKVRRILKRIQTQRKMGILYTSHNMQEVEALCDRVLFIHKGQMMAQGTPSEVRQFFASPSLEQAFIKMVRGGNLVGGDE